MSAASSLANDKRSEYETDWFFSCVIVDDDCDSDHMFEDGLFAWVPGLFKPLVFMTRNNDGWSPDNMDMVMRHETCHVFGAEDEYAESDCADDCNDPHGYLRVSNANCIHCISQQQSCIMASAALQWQHQICGYTRGQIGWWDSDGDGVFDPLDHPESGTYCFIGEEGQYVYPGDYVDIYTLALDWVRRIGISHRNYDLGGTIWDGINFCGLDCLIGTYYWTKNGNGDRTTSVAYDTEPIYFIDVTLTVGDTWQDENSLSIEFMDDDTYAGYIRASVTRTGDPSTEARVFSDELRANTLVQPPITRSFFVPSAGNYTVDVHIWDIGGGHNAFDSIVFDAMPSSSIEEPHSVYIPDWALSPASPSPSCSRVTWNLNLSNGSECKATMHVLDIQGRVIKSWINKTLPNGNTSIIWDGKDSRGHLVPSGKYILCVEPENGESISKSVIITR